MISIVDCFRAGATTYGDEDEWTDAFIDTFGFSYLCVMQENTAFITKNELMVSHSWKIKNWYELGGGIVMTGCDPFKRISFNDYQRMFVG